MTLQHESHLLYDDTHFNIWVPSAKHNPDHVIAVLSFFINYYIITARPHLFQILPPLSDRCTPLEAPYRWPFSTIQ